MIKQSIFISFALLTLAGCSVVGEEEGVCPGAKSGVACASVREVYELTNVYNNAEDYAKATGDERVMVTDEDGETITGKEYKEKYGVDGIMIGRAAIGNPWIFNQIKTYLDTGKKMEKPSLKERISILKKHLKFSIEWKGEKLGLVEMRRHYSNYFRGVENFKEYRMKLVLSGSYSNSKEILNEISEKFIAKENVLT